MYKFANFQKKLYSWPTSHHFIACHAPPPMNEDSSKKTKILIGFSCMDKTLCLSVASFLETGELFFLKFSKKGHPKAKSQFKTSKFYN